jgi:hypothetical protein
MKRFYLIMILLIPQILFAQGQKILFFENFEDKNFAQRGWYDNLKGTLTDKEHIPGSTYSLECKFLQGQRTPTGGTPGRHLFEETEEVCLSYHVKYSENYIGSGKPYHPHEFSFVTNKDNIYVGPAFTHLTTYIEHNAGYPRLAIQDGENINQMRVGQNLVGVTENRGVAGCNGSSDGYPDDCYKSGDLYVNGKVWKSKIKCFSDEFGKYYKSDWHHIEAYFKLNSIVDSKGITDGIIQYWFDGESLFEYNDVLIRTGEHPDMMFNQFLIVPYIGDGSPVEQTMWIDDLTVSTQRISSNSVFNELNELFIYPIPATNYIKINLLAPHNHNRIEQIHIYNILGECVRNYKIQSPTSNYQLDISNIPNGAYYISIKKSISKFIIMR